MDKSPGKDLIDELSKVVYCDAYEQEDAPWSKRARALFDELLLRAFLTPLPKDGLCIEVGVYKGESYLKMVERYGASRCKGIDVRNYADLPNVDEIDIRDMEGDLPIALGINDVSITCPQSKLAAHCWLARNLLPSGILILTGHTLIDLSHYDLGGLSILYKNDSALLLQKGKSP